MPTRLRTSFACRFLGWAAACLLTVAASPARGQDQDSIDLAPRWVEGQTSRFAFTTQLEKRVEITLGDNQREHTVVTDIEGEATWKVQRVTADGGARCVMTLDWMGVVTQANGKETSVDTRKSAPSDSKVMHGVISTMVAHPLDVVVGPDGRVTQLKGVKAMKAKSDRPDLIPDVLDFEETASGMAQFAAAPPPLAVGESWVASFRWNHDLGHVDEDWRYRLESVEDVAGVQLATVTGTAKSRLDVDPEQTQTPEGTPPLRIRLEDRQAQTRVLMDLSRGEAVGRYSLVDERVVAELKLPQGVFRRVMNETATSELIRVAP